MIDSKIEEIAFEPSIVSFIVINGENRWYLTPIDYWVMNHWGQYGIANELSDEDKCLEFINVIEEYRITQSELLEAYIVFDGIESLIPKIYIDFDNYLFNTNYGEWTLEDSTLPIWNSSRVESLDLIPLEKRYWEDSNSNI